MSTQYQMSTSSNTMNNIRETGDGSLSPFSIDKYVVGLPVYLFYIIFFTLSTMSKTGADRICSCRETENRPPVSKTSYFYRLKQIIRYNTLHLAGKEACKKDEKLLVLFELNIKLLYGR